MISHLLLSPCRLLCNGLFSCGKREKSLSDDHPTLDDSLLETDPTPDTNQKTERSGQEQFSLLAISLVAGALLGGGTAMAACGVAILPMSTPLLLISAVAGAILLGAATALSLLLIRSPHRDEPFTEEVKPHRDEPLTQEVNPHEELIVQLKEDEELIEF